MTKLLKKLLFSVLSDSRRHHGPAYGKRYGKLRKGKKKAYGYGYGWPQPYLPSPGHGHRPFGGGLKGVLLQALVQRLQRRG